jgi:ATP-dependent helicase/nuclease subunit B
MQARFLLGPAGSGKTHRCLVEIREELLKSPEGLPLVLLAPKQATFQLERQLLADPAAAGLAGYTRLHILSFDRFAGFTLEKLQKPPPKLLSEEGRVMVLRALLAQKQKELKIFRATARLPGFAQQLSLLLRELQRHQLLDERLAALARREDLPAPLRDKLHDLALLLRAYLDWLKDRQLQDANRLLDVATDALRSQSATGDRQSAIRFAGLWLDGFAEMTPQERKLLNAVAPFCRQMTLAFCLDSEPPANVAWHSPWSLVAETYQQCRNDLAAVEAVQVEVEVLSRKSKQGRFAGQTVLQHLEQHWPQPQPFRSRTVVSADEDRRDACPALEKTLGVAVCPNPEAEAVLAAREILGHVRAGGRYRDCAVLLRTLEGYHHVLRRVFGRYEIPFFLDRREPVAHHPQAELTRYALRIVAFGWKPEDWFGALKTGFVEDDQENLDRLENEALARGWKGDIWKQPLRIADDEHLEKRLERFRQRIVPPFQRLAKRLMTGTGAHQSRPTGAELTVALREFWDQLRVEEQLEKWSATESGQASTGSRQSPIHQTVWEQMRAWLDNLALAFPNESMPLREWLTVLEAGLAGLTVGVIPPTLDQVLIGAIDRSRNPDLQLALVLGMNESIFPAAPVATGLLTEMDRDQLEAKGVVLGPSKRVQLGHERYYGYIACTRAGKRLVLTCASFDPHGRKLNRSPFLDRLESLFPQLKFEIWQPPDNFERVEHVTEILPRVLQLQHAGRASAVAELLSLPKLSSALARARQVSEAMSYQRLPSAVVEGLYGRELPTSVSGLEDFAVCPFKFFAGHGLAAEERKRFELDARERGSFQHEVLNEFHRELADANLNWRDITAADARERIRRIGRERLPTCRGGLFSADETRRFAGEMLIESLETLVEVLVSWMGQYVFDPAEVEVAFGLPGATLPAWRLDLGDGHALLLRGRIDRVDLWRDEISGAALTVVMDYKSSAQKPDRLKLYHGLQLQLPAYVTALEQLAEARVAFKANRLRAAGVFYVNLRGEFHSAKSRAEVFDDPALLLRKGYQHSGRYDRVFREKFDRLSTGEQFNLSERSHDPMDPAAFRELLNRTAENLRRFGLEIYAGKITPEPYRKGTETACQRCDFAEVCRFDPWTQPFRSVPEPPQIVTPPAEPKPRRVKKSAKGQ